MYCIFDLLTTSSDRWWKSDEQGEPLFCGKDVARALGYKNPEKALRVHVSLEDKGVNEMVTPPVERSKPSSSTNPASTPSFSPPSY